MAVVACQDRVDHVSITLDGLKLEERLDRGLNGVRTPPTNAAYHQERPVALARGVVVVDLLRLRREPFDLDAARFEDAFA
jgi:hypothetical protein